MQSRAGQQQNRHSTVDFNGSFHGACGKKCCSVLQQELFPVYFIINWIPRVFLMKSDSASLHTYDEWVGEVFVLMPICPHSWAWFPLDLSDYPRQRLDKRSGPLHRPKIIAGLPHGSELGPSLLYEPPALLETLPDLLRNIGAHSWTCAWGKFHQSQDDYHTQFGPGSFEEAPEGRNRGKLCLTTATIHPMLRCIHHVSTVAGTTECLTFQAENVNNITLMGQIPV